MDSSPSLPSIALALSGGGARGLAHIGVLKVLERENIPVCTVAGTSMGGLIASFFAAGFPAGDLEQIACTITQPRNLVRLFGVSRSLHGLIDTSRIRNFLGEYLGESTGIEDLSIPLTLVAVELRTGKEHKLTRGNLVQGVLATTAFPGVFPPVEFEGQVLVDGGILNNLPADAARNSCAEMGARVPCVAVDVSPDFLSDDEDALSPPGFRFLPGFGKDLYQTEIIMISALTKAHLQSAAPEIILRPAIPPHISLLWGFHHPVEAIEAGEVAAEEALPQIYAAVEQASK